MKTINISQILFSLLLCIVASCSIAQGSTGFWSQSLLLFISCKLLLLSVICLYRHWLTLPVHFIKSMPIQALFIIFILWQYFQTLSLNLADRDAQQEGLLLTLTYWIVINLVILLCDKPQRIKVMLWTIAVCAAAQAFYGSIMVLTGIEWGVINEKIYNRGVATGTFVNRNHLAGYLQMGLACGLGLLVTQLSSHSTQGHKERLRYLLTTLTSNKILLRLSLAIMVIALVMTRSRMGNMAFFSAMFIAGFIHLCIVKKFTRSAFILFASLLLIDTLIVSQWFGLDKLADRINLSVSELEVVETQIQTNVTDGQPAFKNHYQLNTDDNREEAWRQMYPLLSEALLLGRGYGSFYTLFPAYRDGSTHGYFDYAHQDYMQFLIEFGLIGTSCIALVVFIALLNSLKAQQRKSDHVYASAGFASMMAIISLAIHSWGDFNLYIPANALTLCVLIGLSVPARWHQAAS